VEELPPEVEARFKEIDAALDAFGDGTAYDPDEVARGGVFVVLGHDGEARIERGLIRPEDEPPAPEPDPQEDGEGETRAEIGPDTGGGEDEPEDEGLAPLSERLVLDLTAHKTVGLRDALGADPTLALTALVHALALKTFYPPYDQPSCLEVKVVSATSTAMLPASARVRPDGGSRSGMSAGRSGCRARAARPGPSWRVWTVASFSTCSPTASA
jgi:ParB family chromosome partitioning protein